MGIQMRGEASVFMAAQPDERPVMVEARRAQLVADMEQTLARLKDAAEAMSTRS